MDDARAQSGTGGVATHQNQNDGIGFVTPWADGLTVDITGGEPQLSRHPAVADPTIQLAQLIAEVRALRNEVRSLRAALNR